MGCQHTQHMNYFNCAFPSDIRRASKPKQLSQTNRELHQGKVQEVRGEFESSNKVNP